MTAGLLAGTMAVALLGMTPAQALPSGGGDCSATSANAHADANYIVDAAANMQGTETSHTGTTSGGHEEEHATGDGGGVYSYYAEDSNGSYASDGDDCDAPQPDPDPEPEPDPHPCDDVLNPITTSLGQIIACVDRMVNGYGVISQIDGFECDDNYHDDSFDGEFMVNNNWAVFLVDGDRALAINDGLVTRGHQMNYLQTNKLGTLEGMDAFYSFDHDYGCNPQLLTTSFEGSGALTYGSWSYPAVA
jgi:hypothetical protein